MRTGSVNVRSITCTFSVTWRSLFLLLQLLSSLSSGFPRVKGGRDYFGAKVNNTLLHDLRPLTLLHLTLCSLGNVPDYLNTTETSRDIWVSKDGLASRALKLGGFFPSDWIKPVTYKTENHHIYVVHKIKWYL